MIREDIANAVRKGWEWAEDTDLPSMPDAIDPICEEASDRYTRIERQRAFARACAAAVIHRN